ncbi:Uncharacterised protein [Bordetella pertussis]|nr:Uncharacterised protein [Bordetella pertussis]
MRRTASRPQLCAISVALLAHGDIVPRRGMTSSSRLLAGVSAAGVP